ncbi:MAG TPA: response regulator [Candidatus Angelobacter sp.]|nr:response regulator [Candidatus Angelobacter sp.]
MSLRILFADDSVTAQNMGRKILTDAGYEVVAVSNGAAAVKKIAEQKPDIIILDVYMPGYSGLEVCEKVRGSVATLKTPVLLTVGKMEPYRPEETNRVRADGVIVKPFEASDLLAIVKKFEERIGQAPPVPEPAPVERLYEEAPEEAPLEIPEAIVTKTQATVDVPDHMATSSAFSDLLGTDSGHSMNNFHVPPAPAPRAAAPEPTPIRTQIPEYVAPDSWRDKIDGQAEPFSAAVPATPQASNTGMTETISRPSLQIPVYQEPEEVVAEAEVLPTAAPPTGEIEIPREPELQESAAEQTRNTVADAREPGLISTVHEESAPPTTETAQPVTTEDAPLELEQSPAPSFAEALATAGGPVAELPVVAPVSHEEIAPVAAEAQQSAAPDSDFEARVAAAMAAYGQAPESDATAEPIAVSAEPASEPARPASQMEAPSAVTGAAPATEAAPAENVHQPVVSTSQAPAPSVDYYPPASYTEPIREEEITPQSVAHSPVVRRAPSLEKEPTPAEVDYNEPAPAEVEHVVAASVEAAVPVVAAAAAGAGAGTDHHTIAQAVHRVMERLKPELVEEIMRELKPKE